MTTTAVRWPRGTKVRMKDGVFPKTVRGRTATVVGTTTSERTIRIVRDGYLNAETWARAYWEIVAEQSEQ